MKSVKKFILFMLSLMTVMILFVFTAVCTQHEHSFCVLYSVRPTCTEKGYTVFACECGESYSGSEISALGHKFSSERVYYKKATCLEKGEAGRYCERCYEKKDVVFYDKTAHIPVYIKIKATDKKDGEIRRECSVCKKLYSRKTISKISSVMLEKKVYTYDGKIKSPSVIITDSKGECLEKNNDYTLSYQKGRKKTGIFAVKIVFKGNYEGEKTLYFKIRPTKVKNLTAVPSISSVYLSWDKSKGANGYEIYIKSSGKLKLLKDTENLYYTVRKINGKTLKSGTDYVFVIKSYKMTGDKKVYSSESTIKVSTRPSKAKFLKVNRKAGKIAVRISKQSCHGYELLISTNKSFSNPKTVKLKGKNKTSYTIKNTKYSKGCYIKVRAYVISGGEKYYGYYSDVKNIKG